MIRTPVKSLESTRLKVDKWGDIRSVTDLARATVVCDTPNDLADAFELLNSMLPQVSRMSVAFYNINSILALLCNALLCNIARFGACLSSKNPIREVSHFRELWV